jgi:hypothetical protein
MNHLVRFTSLVTLGGWLLSASAWAGDTTETAASGATTTPSASTNTTTADVPRPVVESAKAGVAKAEAQNSPQSSAGAHANEANTANVPKASDDPLTAKVMDDAALSNARGGADTHLNQNTSTGAVSGNVASQLTTGSNTISEGSFSNTSGIPIVIQNSGNNVLIQNSTILNLQLESPK